MTAGRCLAVVALLVLAGCTAPIDRSSDPYGDELGWEDGYWYDESLDVDASDGLDESEREAVVARTMARVERIRGLEFVRSVPVEVVSRAEFRNRSGGFGASDRNETYSNWNDQVWEALFLVGENQSFEEVYGDVLGTAVAGFYSSSEGQIVIVSDSETPTIHRATLAHELVHALQDQHFSFGPAASTQDQQLANNGLTEGDANLVMRRYEERCAAEWECIPAPERPSSGGNVEGFQFGVFLTIYQPYATGPGFVAALEERGGWTAVNDAYERFPASTEQVIHPQKYPDEEPAAVTVPDRSRGGWERFPLDSQTETVGEASVYATFQANDQLDDVPRYRYVAPPSAGWGGDTVVPYRNGDRYGYVWRTTWDTERDAREFAAAYRDLLRHHGATRDGDVWVVPESSAFGDAFRVTRSGATVTVVNGPTERSLDRIHERK